MISKMIWLMFDAIGSKLYARYSIPDESQKNKNMRDCIIEYRESRIQYHFDFCDTVINWQKVTLN